MIPQRRNYPDNKVPAQGLLTAKVVSSTNMSSTGDDDLPSEVDEPPDEPIDFTKLVSPRLQSFASDSGHESATPQYLIPDRKESLLTQALLSSPELNPSSDAEAPVLTSDGGLTSPARTTTPSPPLPIYPKADLTSSNPEAKHDPSFDKITQRDIHTAQSTEDKRPEESSVEAGLGRKRCISFACGRQSTSQKSNELPLHSQDNTKPPAKASDPPKRPCMLRFACPMRPSRTESDKFQSRPKSTSPPNSSESSIAKDSGEKSEPGDQAHRDSINTSKENSSQNASIKSDVPQPWKGKIFNRRDFQNSEATRFHEFAGPFIAEDEWTNEQTVHRKKITINDTLRKENAIRKLAQEAEEEALDEEDEGEIAEEDIEDESDDGEFSEDDTEHISDDGNESDDEEGFAESDDESDGNSDYHFWTPGLTTAATSTDHLEHIRPVVHRVASNSSIESMIHVTNEDALRQSSKALSRSQQLRTSTPDLPDSSDFVVGTIDEDRPLEEAYLSCLEQRRRSKHKILPQDIDPSFPTSDSEVDKEDREEESITHLDNDTERARGRREDLESAAAGCRTKHISSAKAKRSLTPSPISLLSPPPRRKVVHQSPPPRRLFGQPTHRLRSPPPLRRKLTSPPSSRRPSFSSSPSSKVREIHMPHLAQRPNLTHTTSLPKTPNPFWGQHRRSRLHDAETPSAGTSPRTVREPRAEVHSRGPIDIVQGLEAKRQRRKEKYWRQHCRASGKEKVRCRPGKGAERMRELGLEMAERCRGYGQKAHLVLSV